MPRSPALTRLLCALAALAGIAVLLPIGVLPSQAAFIAHSANPGAVFTAASDFNTVAVSLTDPGSPLRGDVTLTATAASDRGMSSVVFQSSAAGAGAWTNACTDNAAPFTCTWDTTSVGDGLRDVRAVATDTAGYSRTDTVTNRRVDNTAPSASTTDPGSPLTGSVTVSGSASDGGSGLAAVTLQYRSTTGSWTDLCTQATSPISCSWNTAPLADGLYDLRTLATDAAGNSQISAPVYNRRVDNTTPTITLTNPGTPLRGSVTLQSTSADGAEGSGVASVRYEYKPSAGSTWTTACTSASTPFSCPFDTASAADGLYDFRAVAIDGVALSGTSATVTNLYIDNTAPAAVTLGAVASPMQNTVGLTGTATDAGSGVVSLRFQRAPAGTTTWTDICTDASSPYTCSFDTTTVADALYDMRALATDDAGNTTASTVQTNRRVDNNGPVVALTSPVAGLMRGTINAGGTATDGVGVSSTTFEYRQGANPWTTICSDATPAYSCPALPVADGTYDVRMTAVDTLGHTSTSAVVTVIVDNTAPTATDVQAANGGTSGRIDAGDTVTFTWSDPLAPASILSGWSGASQAIRVRVTEGTDDTLDLYDSTGATRLNVMSATQALNLDVDVVSATSTFNATIVMAGSTATVTIGSLISGTVRTNANKKGDLTWTPSTAATDLAGNPVTATAVTETGTNDRDF